MRRPNSSGRPGPSPFQKGILPGSPGAGVTRTRSWVISTMRQVDAPRMKVSPGVTLEDHLLVEFADAHGFAFAVGEEDAVEAAVGDGAGVENGEAGGAVAGGDDVADAVPGEARAELGELVGGITAAEQVEDAFEGRAGEGAEGSGAADEVEEEVDADFGLGDWLVRWKCRVDLVVSQPCDRKPSQGWGTQFF